MEECAVAGGRVRNEDGAVVFVDFWRVEGDVD